MGIMKTAGKKLGGLLKKTVSWAVKHPETTSGIVDLSATLIKKRSKKNPQPQENSNLKNIAMQKNLDALAQKTAELEGKVQALDESNENLSAEIQKLAEVIETEILEIKKTQQAQHTWLLLLSILGGLGIAAAITLAIIL